MSRAETIILAASALVLFCMGASAQEALTGAVTGRVSADGRGLPGVRIRFESPALQGSRQVVTQVNGDYVSPFLPPGLYTISFELEGFRPLVAEDVKVSTQQVRRLDIELVNETFEGETEVFGARETVSQQVAAQTTVPMELFDKLPIRRSAVMTNAALLAPGVQDTGARGVSIAGAMSVENLWLVNGIDVTTASAALFIEDAVLEMTTSVSGIPAAFGRFQGGVVNVLTRSGGNEFSGSFRTTLTSDAWIARTPLSPERNDSIDTRFEATLGGRVLRDTLWFFVAGRSIDAEENRLTTYTQLPYSWATDQRRFEGKVTWAPNQDHRMVVSHTGLRYEFQNTNFGRILDLASLNPKKRDTTDALSVNYTGVLGPNLFLEGLYSRGEATTGIGAGSPYTDVVRGTLLVDQSRGFSRYHTPTFCSARECLPTEGGPENWYLKGSWFVGSESLGTHELVLGYDRFSYRMIRDLHQQGSDFRIDGSTAIVLDDGSVYPVFAPDGRTGYPQTFYWWTPIFVEPQESDFATTSWYMSDTWRLDSHWSFVIGARYDANVAVDSVGSTVADDSRVSPRLGVTWDVTGDGGWLVNAGYAQYVALLNEWIANYPSGAGLAARIRGLYTGPCVNCAAYESGDFTNLVSQDDAIRIWYEWFQANGGTANPPNLLGGEVPGYTPQIPESLASPMTTEWSLGVTKRLGSRGVLRVDLVDRDSSDFYVTDNLPGRTVTTNFGEVLDLAYLTNDPGVYRRTYRGLHTSFQYRIGDRWQLGGAWTLARARGNFDGETWNSGAVSGDLLEYREYRETEWNAPIGWLAVDQRHQLRAWGVWDAIAGLRHNLSLSALFSYFSGTSFSNTAAVQVGPYVENPGYQTPPRTMTYYFGERGGERWDAITSTNLGVSYGFTFAGGIELFLQLDILNVFNRQGQIDGDTTIRVLEEFDPFTEQPVRGVHWEYGPRYREPVNEADFQHPREVQASVGIRF